VELADGSLGFSRCPEFYGAAPFRIASSARVRKNSAMNNIACQSHMIFQLLPSRAVRQIANIHKSGCIIEIIFASAAVFYLAATVAALC
jgi:hypothetical protein